MSTCVAVKKNGEVCGLKSKDNSGYCGRHKPEAVAKRKTPKAKGEAVADDSTICVAITKAGTRCTFKAKPGTRYCGRHGPANGQAVTPKTPVPEKDESKKAESPKKGDAKTPAEVKEVKEIKSKTEEDVSLPSWCEGHKYIYYEGAEFVEFVGDVPLSTIFPQSNYENSFVLLIGKLKDDKTWNVLITVHKSLLEDAENKESSSADEINNALLSASINNGIFASKYTSAALEEYKKAGGNPSIWKDNGKEGLEVIFSSKNMQVNYLDEKAKAEVEKLQKIAEKLMGNVQQSALSKMDIHFTAMNSASSYTKKKDLTLVNSKTPKVIFAFGPTRHVYYKYDGPGTKGDVAIIDMRRGNAYCIWPASYQMISHSSKKHDGKDTKYQGYHTEVSFSLI